MKGKEKALKEVKKFAYNNPGRQDLTCKHNSKGITLISLVVTIIVLLILAGVTIMTLFGDNGLINMAQKAKSETENSQANDIVGMDSLIEQMDGVINANKKHSLEELREKIAAESGDCMIDMDGKIFPTNVWDYYCGSEDSFGIGIDDEYESCVAYNGKILEDGNLEYGIPVYLKEGGKIYTIKEIAYFALENLEMKNIIIPNTITRIGSNAFGRCYNLTHITIPSSVKSINDNAFGSCISLTEVSLTDGLQNIGSSAFADCSITTISIPSSVKSIGSYAFSGCNKLTSVEIPEGVTDVADSTFCDCTKLTSVSIPNSVTKIGYSAFRRCDSLTNITLPDSLTKIGQSAFRDCTGLSTVTIPDGIQIIGPDSFRDCTNLNNVSIPNSVTKIDFNAFYGCTSLTNLTIPNSVTTIGKNAFLDVPHVYYNGTATGSPWGAKAVN